jgi:hypothetical protein
MEKEDGIMLEAYQHPSGDLVTVSVPQDRVQEAEPITQDEVAALQSCLTYLAVHQWRVDKLVSLYRKLLYQSVQSGKGQ